MTTLRRFVREAHGRSYVIELYLDHGTWRWRVEDYPNLQGKPLRQIGRGYIGQRGVAVETRGCHAREKRLFDGVLPELAEQLREITRAHHAWQSGQAIAAKREARKEHAA